MSSERYIQSKILEMSGGEFERLFDAYVYKKFGLKNIQTLGIQSGTNKPTFGTPDSYVLTDDGKYILITCGSVERNSVKKIKSDILACLDKTKVSIDREKIKKIICGHTSTNIHMDQFESIRNLLGNIEVELIGIDTIAHDLTYLYPIIAKEHLNISVDTNQILDIDSFVSLCDKSKISAPIDCNFWYRDNELKEVIDSVENNKITTVLGASGVGKTRLVLEVCRKYQEQGWNVFCIRSNGRLLYDDIPRYFDGYGKYLLFFDDANQVVSFEGILDYIYSMDGKYEIKLIFTVRDYAKKRVIETALKYEKPSIINIKEFKDKEIKDIIKNNFGIENHEYLNRIAYIARGNVRLAVLAGLKSLDGGLLSLRSALDVFENYYGSIFDDNLLTTEEIMYMCIVAIVGPVRMKNNPFYNGLLSTHIKKDVNAILSRLFELELVDWFKDEVVNISDQTMGDFVLYYVIYVKKWISLCEIIKVYFPQYKDRIIYVINTMLGKFASEELKSYVENQIIEAWNTCEGSERSYLEAFYMVNPIKALTIIKELIDRAEYKELNISEEEIEKCKNHNNISSKEIEILSSCRYLECHEEAVDLLLIYYSKRPDLFMDFYFAFTNNLLYDKNSFYLKYRYEEEVISKIWNLCNEGEDFIFSLLYIYVVESALDTEFDYIEKGNNREITLCRSTVVLTDEMKRMRFGIWKSLFVLRKKKVFYSKINEILIKRHIIGLNDDLAKEFVLFDFNSIIPFIEENIDYFDAKIIDSYREDAISFHMDLDDRMLRADENECFKVLNLLSRRHELGRDIEEDEQIRKKIIWNEIQYYSSKDFISLFRKCKRLEEYESENMWELDSGIKTIFELLKDDKQRYLSAVEAFFINDAPLVNYSINSIVTYLLGQIGFSETREIITHQDFNKKNNWICSIWMCLPESLVTKEITNDFKMFLEQNNNDFIPDTNTIFKYSKFDKSIINCFSIKLINSKDASVRFLRSCIGDEEISELFLLFEGKEDVLFKIYSNALGARIDYEGKIFARLYAINSDIWEQYIDSLKEKHLIGYNEHIIMEYIWNSPDYSDRILYAFDVLIDDLFFYDKDIAVVIFGKNGKQNNIDKKKKWLLEQLNKDNDLNRYKRLVNVVSIVFPEWEVDYILEYLNNNNSIEDFKNLYLFPLMKSWSGSEIPLINRELDFLNKLKDNLRGINFIEHKQYINECIAEKEKYKEHVEIQEYLENAML